MKRNSERTLKMKSLHKSQGILLVILAGLTLSGLMLTGCQTMSQRDMGKWVAPENRVVIESDGPHSQTFRTPDMTLTYQYQTAGNRLKVWGRGDIRYESINELVFHLYFLDAKYEVISYHDFFSYLDHSDFAEEIASARQFHRDFNMPAGAHAFAIGYDGETMPIVGRGRIDLLYTPFD
jgi:hypothetical protein